MLPAIDVLHAGQEKSDCENCHSAATNGNEHVLSVAALLSECHVRFWEFSNQELSHFLTQSSRLNSYWRFLLARSEKNDGSPMDVIADFMQATGVGRRIGPLWIGTNSILDRAAFVFCEAP